DPGVADPAFCPYEPLRHHRQWPEERSRDIRGRETAQEPQRERDLRGWREGRMAAGEDETELIVTHGALLGRPGGGMQVGLGMARVARRFSTKHVDGAVARGGDDPSRRAWGHPGLWPSVERGGERVLHRLLGEIDVPEDADE